jgi:hypothetical protein
MRRDKSDRTHVCTEGGFSQGKADDDPKFIYAELLEGR